ncbi:MAG: pyridoxal phosphate-dependent aminotransferase [Candidatus Peregrinibacteria bacterium]
MAQKVNISQRLMSMPVSSIRKLTPFVNPLREQGIKIYHLNIGDPDVKTPEVMLNVLRNWSENPIRYAHPWGAVKFLDALLAYYFKLGYSWLKQGDLMATQGGSEALVMSFLGIADHGDEILTFEPFYSNYAVCAAITGNKLVAVPTSIQTGFHLPDEKTIESYITPKTRAILFCSPCNPTGAIYSKKETESLVRLAKKHNLFLLSDEVYREYTFDAKTPAISLLDYMQDIPEQAIVLDSLSKRYSLCGARVGNLVTMNHELMKGFHKIAQSRLSGSLISQFMGAQLLEVPDSYTEEVVEEYRHRRDILVEGLLKVPGVTTYKPEGAFYLMVALPVDDADDFCQWLLTDFHPNKETVMLAPGSGFYGTLGAGKNEVRIAYVLEEKALRRALEILKEGLKEYNKKHELPQTLP